MASPCVEADNRLYDAAINQREEFGMKNLLLAMFAWLLSVSAALAAVNVNTATKEQLDSLKGIGPAKAQAIIDYRTKNGPFKSIDDLEKVPGIGPATLKEIRGEVSLTGATSTTAAEPKKEAATKAKSDSKGGDTKGVAKSEPKKDAGKSDEKAAAKPGDVKAQVKGDDKKATPKADEKKATAKSDDKKAASKDDARKASGDKDLRKDTTPAKDEKK